MNRYTEAMDVRPRMTENEAIAECRRIYDANMTTLEFYDNHRELAEYSIRFLGGLKRIFEISGFNAGLEANSYEVALPNVLQYKPSRITPEAVQREIIRLWYIGYPLNYTAISRKRQVLLKGAKEFFGSWENAVSSVGIEYASVMKGVSSNVLSECGTEFELLFAEILTELNYEYIREGEGLNDVFPEGFTLKPDFILPNWRWIDCKLSEWTDVSEMLKRYSPLEPNGITIVYLRGSKRRRERGSKWRYEHVSVYCFTEYLPEDRRKYYDDKLDEIASKAEVGAVAK